MFKFNATIEIKDGKIYITPEGLECMEYVELETYIYKNKEKTFNDIYVLPF